MHTVEEPAKALEVGKSCAFSIIPGGNGAGPVYGAAFCLKRIADGGVVVIQQRRDTDSCAP